MTSEQLTAREVEIIAYHNLPTRLNAAVGAILDYQSCYKKLREAKQKLDVAQEAMDAVVRHLPTLNENLRLKELAKSQLERAESEVRSASSALEQRAEAFFNLGSRLVEQMLSEMESHDWCFPRAQIIELLELPLHTRG